MQVSTAVWVKKKYTRLMSHKNVTNASTLKIWLGFNSKSLNLYDDMKNNGFGSLSIKPLTLEQSASFWKLAKIGQK